MTDYINLGLALSVFQTLKMVQAVQFYHINRLDTPHLFWRVVITLVLAYVIFWLPQTQHAAAYLVLGFYAFRLFLNAFTLARPDSVAAKVLCSQGTDLETQLAWIHDENQQLAEDQVRLAW